MAYPTWITAVGNLGIVPCLEYYQYQLDAYDTAGGTLVYAKISGTLPPGIQITPEGVLQGIPVSTAGPDQNQKYTFTVRVVNQSDGLLADRTFFITITNVAPPVITPHSTITGNINLGSYFDGTTVGIQLVAEEFIRGNNLTWTLKAGSLPPGLRLTLGGLITGYIIPIPAVGPIGIPGWDDTDWDGTYTTATTSGRLAWDFSQGAESKTFQWTVEVSDGTTNSDTSTYRMLVIPKTAYDADTTLIDADATKFSGNALTVDAGAKHTPIITSIPSDILPERQGSWFTFKISAVDLDDDVLYYDIPALSVGSFDQQDPSGYPYVDAIVTNGNISIGTVSIGSSTPYLTNGTNIEVLSPYTDVTTTETYYTWYNATVNAHTTLRITGNTIVTGIVGTYITQTIGGANATIINVGVTTGTITLKGNISYANVGDVIRQTTSVGQAIVIGFNNSFDANTVNPNTLRVRFTSGAFDTVGNITVNGIGVAASPTSVVCNTDIGAIYNTTSLFYLNSTDSTARVNVSGALTYSYPTKILSVGVDVDTSPNTQGNIGFDEQRFDQGSLSMPGTLAINHTSGWITGFLPAQVANSTSYNFLVKVSKRDYPEYVTDSLFTITILGSLNNNVNWLTPGYLGTVENGSTCDLSVIAFSSQGKNVYYVYTPDAYINLPQGLRLQPDGLISGRVSFELFSVDAGLTTFDSDYTGNPQTTFDHTFTFSVDAITFDQTAATTRVFSILVRGRNIKPYENLYLTAQLKPYQRIEFRSIVQDQAVFPPSMIYRNSDPWFGISDTISTLFLPGLSPSTKAAYTSALQTNHFRKRLLFGEVKTAVARTDGVYDVIENASGNIIGTYNVYTSTFIPTDYTQGYVVLTGSIPSGTTIGDQHVKYEVVYLDIVDENTNAEGQGPADSINLNGVITNPYLDQGNAYVIATPNAFSNMKDAVINAISYANKGALPDWMTSTQPNGKVLGFTRAVVLAYTKPNESKTIAWRLKQRGYNLNELNFTADRYLLDNAYSANYDVTANAFITSRQTTFDRYPGLLSIFKTIGTVDYAVNTAFEEINERAVSTIISNGGLDGITSFQTGDTLVFFEQEYNSGQDIGDSYNQGWTNSTSPWDDPDTYNGEWDENSSQPWDAAAYVPGYKEWLGSKFVSNTGVVTYSVANQRMSIWKVSIDNQGFLRLNLANVNATATRIYANSTGYGTKITVANADGIFVGMKLIATGFNTTSAVTDINSTTITVYPANVSTPPTGTITFIPTLNYNQTLYVRNGLTHGGINIYYDPVLKADKLVANFSKIPQQIKTISTIFDGNGTRFFDYRDSYTTPGQGDTGIIFPHLNVFD
jgi:hypothetical protein